MTTHNSAASPQALPGASGAPASERLPIITKLAFGVGDLGPAIVAGVRGFFLNAFLLEVAGLSPYLAAPLFLIIQIWDAVNDPIIGALTDRTNTRWGRRRPWLLFGAVPFGLAFFLTWLVPDIGQTAKFFYYLIIGILLDTSFTVINVPYTALTPELTADYDERTSLNSYRFSFSIVGGVVASALHPVIVGMFPNDVTRGYAVSAAVWSCFIIASALITFAFIREKPGLTASQPDEQLGFLEGVRIAFRNRAFVYATLVYLLSWLSLQFIQANLQLYVRYWAQLDEATQFPILILGIQLTAFVFLFIWSAVSRRIGKKGVYYVGVTLWIGVLIGLFFIPPGQFIWLLGLGVLAGAGVSLVYLVPWSLLPDVLELDELETGQRREGIFYGFFVFLQKLGLAAGLAISNLVLGVSGYINPHETEVTTQPEATLLVLRLFVSFIPAAVLAVSFLAMRRYPITRESHAAVRAELEQRRLAAKAGG